MIVDKNVNWVIIPVWTLEGVVCAGVPAFGPPVWRWAAVDRGAAFCVLSADGRHRRVSFSPGSLI